MIEQIHIEKGIPIPPRLYPGGAPRLPGSCHCGRMPEQADHKTCNRCLANVKQQYQKRKAAGMCGWGTACPNEAAEGHSMCDSHLQRSSKTIIALLNGRVAKGLCRRCGKRPIWTTTYCVPCHVNFGRSGHPLKFPVPVSIRRIIRKFWRDDRIAQRREYATQAVSLIRDQRLKEVVSFRHGLIDGVDHSLDSVGKRFGVTRERIRQIEAKAYGLLEELGVSTAQLKQPFDIQRPPAKRQTPKPAEVKKERARRALRDAVADGRVIKKPCEKCGRTDKISGHHFDYDRPLDVIWVCPPHHAEAHGKTIRNEQKKRYVFPSWLERVDHSHSDLYNAPYILETLKREQLPQGVVIEATGLTHQILRRLIRGEAVEDDALLTMLRYVESLKTKAA